MLLVERVRWPTASLDRSILDRSEDLKSALLRPLVNELDPRAGFFRSLRDCPINALEPPTLPTAPPESPPADRGDFGTPERGVKAPAPAPAPGGGVCLRAAAAAATVGAAGHTGEALGPPAAPRVEAGALGRSSMFALAARPAKACPDPGSRANPCST